MSGFDALYKRYLDEANAYAAKFGLDPTTASRDGHWDAFRHAYASAAMTKEYGRPAAHLFGDANEVRGDLFHDQKSFSKHMDRWNNAVGRRLAEGAADKDEIARRAYDALRNGDLIIDPVQDGRCYTGPTLLPSPYDYDRNHIYEGPLPPPPGAPAATGSPSPTLGSTSPIYYSGQADPPSPEDHPLSQEEIERIRQSNGVPKGGLF